jgi:hypothetical protein
MDLNYTIFKNINRISKLLERNYFMKSILLASLIATILFANISLFSKVTAESGIGKDVFKVVVTLFGITNSTKDIMTLVNVKDQTKVEMFNAENPEGQAQDMVSYTMTFPNLAVDDDEEYNVCTMSVEDFKLECREGKNSPLNRPEFVDINLSGGGSVEEAENDGEAGDEGDDED